MENKMDAEKDERIKEITSKLLSTLSYEQLETELQKIANYHCIDIAV